MLSYRFTLYIYRYIVPDMFFICIYLTASCSDAAVKIIPQIPREGCWGAEPCLEGSSSFIPHGIHHSQGLSILPCTGRDLCLPALLGLVAALELSLQCWALVLPGDQPVDQHSIKPFALTPGVLVKVVQIMEAKSSPSASGAERSYYGNTSSLG